MSTDAGEPASGEPEGVQDTQPEGVGGPADATPVPQSSERVKAFPPPADLMALAKPPAITKEVLSSVLLQADKLAEVEIVPRENLLGTWFRQGDLGFIFGERGLGKTWLSLDIARGLAEGRSVGPWKVPKARRSLYVDGEMPLDEIRDRDAALRRGDGGLFILNHEWIFQKKGCVLNLTDRGAQAALLALCVAEGVEVLFLDNLSCLFNGVAENDADEWEKVLPWLLELRRRKIAVVMVHHANRTGQNMRGTSRREDAAFWVLRLDGVPDPAKESEGARFISRFTKLRQGTRQETEPLQWAYEPDGKKVRVTYKSLPTVEIFKQWLRDGLDNCTDIAADMGISKGMVSKLAQRGVREGWLVTSSRKYKLVDVPVTGLPNPAEIHLVSRKRPIGGKQETKVNETVNEVVYQDPAMGKDPLPSKRDAPGQGNEHLENQGVSLPPVPPSFVTPHEP
jgi:hypothetical protein